MYANILVDSEKEAFILLLYYLSIIDGEMSDRKYVFIKACCNELGLEEKDFHERYKNVKLSLPFILKKFKTLISKHTVLIELINLAYIDQSYSDDEKKGLRYIASEMGVKESKIEEIEKWGQEGLTWTQKGLAIIAT